MQPTIETLTEETVRLSRLAFAWSTFARALIRQRDAVTEHAKNAAAVDIAHAEAELRAMGAKL